MDAALETHGLTRRFGDLTAVDQVDLVVPSGSFYGFLGPNGAGKSTTIKCVTGLLRPTAGTVKVLGLDLAHQAVEIKRGIGVLPEGLALFDRLSGAENLTFVGQVFGLDAATLAHRAGELLEVMGLTDARSALVADYSHGMRKKLALSVALLPAPRLLFLDEPFEGIDPVASREIKELLNGFVKSGRTIFLTSHILEVVERLCDHIGIIAHGRLVAQGPIDDVRAEAGAERSLEDRFVELVGAPATRTRLEWLE